MDPLVKVVEGRKNKKEPKDYVNYCGFHLNEKAMASARSKGVVIAERRCKMVKREGAQYCPQHDVVANPNLVVQSLDNPDPERVPCPYSACQYDTYNGFSVPCWVADFSPFWPILVNSFIVKAKLASHLPRCNFRPLAVSYFSQNLHLDVEADEVIGVGEVRGRSRGSLALLSQMPLEELLAIVSKVDGIMKALGPEEPVVERIRLNREMDKELKEATKYEYFSFFY